jgi:hypothetical protein
VSIWDELLSRTIGVDVPNRTVRTGLTFVLAGSAVFLPLTFQHAVKDYVTRESAAMQQKFDVILNDLLPSLPKPPASPTPSSSLQKPNPRAD